MKKAKLGFLGRHIMLKKDFADLVLAGIKTATIRLGVVKPKKRQVLLHSGGRVLAELEITDVEVKKVRELTDEDAKQDGFQSKQQLIENLEKIYGRLRPDDNVTIIRFRVLRRIEGSEAEEESKYLGLKPVDIASIAIRYGVKLHPRDMIIIKKVAETGSIRKAAIALFGDVTRRKAIRIALNKALKKLMEAGVIKRGEDKNHKS
ncbi:MAG: ASCH domain-containing protein [Candidatus Nezhaarchaeales archaeon]